MSQPVKVAPAVRPPLAWGRRSACSQSREKCARSCYGADRVVPAAPMRRYHLLSPFPATVTLIGFSPPIQESPIVKWAQFRERLRSSDVSFLPVWFGLPPPHPFMSPSCGCLERGNIRFPFSFYSSFFIHFCLSGTQCIYLICAPSNNFSFFTGAP